MLQKTYSKTGQSCRVTFRLAPGLASESAALCGEFNEWQAHAHQLERRKDGSFSTTVSLEPGRQYRFRYLLDGQRWENDDSADAYVPNGYGTEDSILEL